MSRDNEPLSLNDYEEMTDAEYEAAMKLAAVIGLARRFGPTPEELAELPWWKRLAARLTPQDRKWKFSPFAQAIRDHGLDKKS